MSQANVAEFNEVVAQAKKEVTVLEKNVSDLNIRMASLQEQLEQAKTELAKKQSRLKDIKYILNLK